LFASGVIRDIGQKIH